MQRGGHVVIHLLAKVQPKTIEPFIKGTIVPGTLVSTDEYSIDARLQSWGYGHKSVHHGGGSSPAMTMVMAFAQSLCIRWKASGRSYGVGCVHTGVFPKRNSRCTWGSSSSCTTCASGVKRYWVRSLSYWSHKTLESNKSDTRFLRQHGQVVWSESRCCGHRYTSPSSMSRRIVARTASDSIGHAVMTAWRSACTSGARTSVGTSWISVGNERELQRRSPTSPGAFWCGFGSDWEESVLMSASRSGIIGCHYRHIQQGE
jgi:hypothetical protein